MYKKLSLIKLSAVCGLLMQSVVSFAYTNSGTVATFVDEDFSYTVKQNEAAQQDLQNEILALTDEPVPLFTNADANKYGSSNKETNLTLGNFLSVMPLDNPKITSHFGGRVVFGQAGNHKGVDFGAAIGTPIYATGHGVVTFAGWKNGYGNFVEIDHGNGYKTRYAHASQIFVSVGDRVGKKQHIAAVGNTGRSTGPHLHFEIVKDGVQRNPETYLALLNR